MLTGDPVYSQLIVPKLNVCGCLQSNQSFYRKIAGYGMGVCDHEVA